MQTVIYFVRHGKVFNPTNILYGRLPRFGLSEEGKKQIEQTAQFLATQHIDALYSSLQLRARQSATIIQKKLGQRKIHFSKNLLEIRTSLQGSSFSYIKTLNYDVFAGPGKNIQGETIEQIANRMQAFIRFVIKKHPGKKIVAVSHGDPLMIIKAYLEHLPLVNESLRPDQKYIQQGEVYKVICDEYLPLSLTSVFKPI